MAIRTNWLIGAAALLLRSPLIPQGMGGLFFPRDPVTVILTDDGEALIQQRSGAMARGYFAVAHLEPQQRACTRGR